MIGICGRWIWNYNPSTANQPKVDGSISNGNVTNNTSNSKVRVPVKTANPPTTAVITLATQAIPSPAPIQDGFVFLELFTIVCRETSEFREVLKMLLVLLTSYAKTTTITTHRPTGVETDYVKTTEISTTSSATTTSSMRSKLINSVAPVVAVSRDGVWTRMVCPFLSTIRKHSAALAAEMQVSFNPDLSM